MNSISPVTYILLIGFPLLLGIYAQIKVSRAFGKYKKLAIGSGVTGAGAAAAVLEAEGIHDVEIVEIDGVLGDHYDPIGKRLCLSGEVFGSPSVAAVGIAAHEAGHAVQHARAYSPLKWRMTIVPATQFASRILPLVIIGGFFFKITGLITVGIACYALLALFQLVTLPVEFDASRRAKLALGNLGIVREGGERDGVNRVLDAAALTYVAAFVAALGQVFYLLLSRR